MIKLDDDLLNELGLGSLSPDDKKKMLSHIYETLEMRVGMKLAERMSDAQLDEFEQFINTNDEQGALHWLESNFPDYKDVVADEFEKLKLEIKGIAPQILAGGAQQPQPAMPMQPPVDPYVQQQPMPPAPAMPYAAPSPMPPQQPPMYPPQAPPVDGNRDDYNLAA